MKVRTVYLVKEDAQAPEAVKPQVFIETTAAGKVTYGVRVSGRSLAAAGKAARAEFTALRRFVEAVDGFDVNYKATSTSIPVGGL